MKIDGPFYAQMSGAADEAKRLAAIGYDGVYSLEGSWDPFFPLALASEHEPSLDIATGIAVAFPRNHLISPIRLGIYRLSRRGSLALA